MFTQGYWEWHGFLLKDHGRWLKTFLFNTSRSWYLAYGFLKPLGRQRLLEYSEDAYMWSLAYETKQGLMIEFYNIFNEIQLRALIEKIRNFTNQYQLFVLLLNRAVRVSSRGIPQRSFNEFRIVGDTELESIFRDSQTAPHIHARKQADHHIQSQPT